MSLERVRFKLDNAAPIGSSDLQTLEVDLKLKAFFTVCREHLAVFLRKNDGQHAVLHRIGLEDFGKARCYYAADTKIVPTNTLTITIGGEEDTKTGELTSSTVRARDCYRIQSSVQ